MGAIDVGAGATNRATSYSPYYTTFIDKTNPANDNGTLTSFEIWALANMTGVKVGTFSGSGTSWNDRDYESIGNVTAGSKQTFSGLSCTVNTGDILGIYQTSALGTIEADTSGGSGVLYIISDAFGQGALTFTLDDADACISLYATGATAGWANIAKINGIAAGSIAKIDGVAVASIAKVNGVAV